MFRDKTRDWVLAAEEKEGEQGRMESPMEEFAKACSRGALQGRPMTENLGKSTV